LNTAADSVLLLFFGGLVLAQAAVKVGMDRWWHPGDGAAD
jgi:hypothetical protein